MRKESLSVVHRCLETELGSAFDPAMFSHSDALMETHQHHCDAEAENISVLFLTVPVHYLFTSSITGIGFGTR